MNILIAPNSMKGSLSAKKFADIIEKALLESGHDFVIRKVPVADGGDGTADLLIDFFHLTVYQQTVKDPLQRGIQAKLGFQNGIAVIEMADASGMKLLDEHELNPLAASSFGTGQLILKAIELGAKKIFLCIGGSATVDGGMGMLEALGVRFYNKKNNLLNGNGINLQKIDAIDFHALKKSGEPEIKIICDVTNPLLGIEGAANIFGPQKGATPEMVGILENGLANFAGIIQNITGINVSVLAGSGAAGGIAMGLIAFLNAEIVNGAEYLLDLFSFNNHVQWCDAVITGEGKLDSQTLKDKAPFAVAQMAKKYNKPVFAIVGQNEFSETGLFKKILSLTNSGVSISDAMANAEKLVLLKARDLANYLF
ncbi:MAG: glycerate kinase [Prolixibacteraceae bacterium]|nr:glycerate kinase [Prolixibacteraceae bacterium]